MHWKTVLGNCRFVCGDIREKLGATGFKPDLMIIDPPRAGMHKDVLAENNGPCTGTNHLCFV